ncbi:PE/PPE C-terminal domain-containing protein, partial [Mycobacterium tuberculosis]
SWSTAAPATAAGAALDGTGWAVPEEDGPIAVMPPAPGMVVAANSVGADSGPRYGVKPIVMPKHGLF